MSRSRCFSSKRIHVANYIAGLGNGLADSFVLSGCCLVVTDAIYLPTLDQSASGEERQQFPPSLRGSPGMM